MTAETLKPFLVPGDSYVTASHSSASSVRSQRSRYLIAIVASALVFLLLATMLGLTVWNTVRLANMQTEVDNLNRVIESMQNRLGLTYLDDLNDLEKEDENNNKLIDDILPDDDEEDDDDIGSEMNSGDNYDEDDEEDDDDMDDDDDEDDDDDLDYTYDELIKKYSHYEDEDDDDYEDKSDPTKNKDNDDDEDNSNEDTMEHANLYDDFEKFKESKRKHRGERKPRSITNLNNVDGNHEADRSLSHRSPHHKPIVASENIERRRSPLRHHHSRRRKFPLIKSGDSFVSAKTLTHSNTLNEIELTKPAAHFHLTHKVPYHRASLRVHTYNGDMYIGKPSWTNERDALDSFFHVENGVLTVRESGMYYVYAQVCYNNHFPQNGFIIFHGHKPFLQCLSNIYTNGDTVINTCHTSGLIYLKQDEHLHIRDFHADRRAHLEETSNRSYFGLIKI